MEDTKMLEPSPSSRKAWAVMLSLFAVGIAMAWGQNKILPIVTIVMTDLNVSAQLAGWISSVFSLMGIIMAFPAAAMIRKLGVRTSCFLAIVVSFAGCLVGIFAPNEYVLLLSRVIEGFGVGVIGVLAPSVISMWFPIDKRGLPMGIWSSWLIVGVAGTYLLTGFILGEESSWQNMFIVGIACYVVAFALAALFVRAPQDGEPNYADSTSESVPLREVFKSPSLYIISLGAIGFGIAINTFCTWIPTYWAEMGAMSLMEGNAAIGYIYVGEIFACIFGGVLLNRIKKRKKFAGIIAICYSIVLFLAYHTGGSFGGAVAVCIGYFFFEGAFVASMWTLVPQTVKDPKLVAGAIALFTMFNNLGMMIGSPLSGAILDATGMTGWGVLSLVAGGCQLVAGVCFLVMKLYDPKGNVVNI